MRRIAIVGSRRLSDWQGRVIRQELAHLTIDTIIVTGDAAGVDRRVRGEAMSMGFVVAMCWAPWRGEPWHAQEKAAGPARNSVIVDLADECIALPDAKSRGTWDTVNKFRAAGKPVRVLREGEP